MPTYAIEKSSDGRILSCASWRSEKIEIPSGFTACSAEEYSAAKAAITSSVRNQALAALVDLRAKAAMATAMGETFGEQTRNYVRAVQAIADGSDVKSIALPAAPASLSD